MTKKILFILSSCHQAASFWLCLQVWSASQTYLSSLFVQWLTCVALVTESAALTWCRAEVDAACEEETEADAAEVVAGTDHKEEERGWIIIGETEPGWTQDESYSLQIQHLIYDNKRRQSKWEQKMSTKRERERINEKGKGDPAQRQRGKEKAYELKRLIKVRERIPLVFMVGARSSFKTTLAKQDQKDSHWHLKCLNNGLLTTPVNSFCLSMHAFQSSLTDIDSISFTFFPACVVMVHDGSMWRASHEWG